MAVGSCPGCGKALSGYHAYCPHCGVSIEWIDESKQAATSKASSNWAPILVGLALAVAGVWAFNALNKDSPADAGIGPPAGPPNSVVAAKEYRGFVHTLPNYLTFQQAQNDEAAVSNAIAQWNQAGIAITRTYSQQDANVLVQFIKEWGGDTLGQQFGDGGGLLQIGVGDSRCSGEWVPFSAQSVQWITMHELGHGFGYPHSTDPSSLMYPSFDPSYADYCKLWDDQTSWSAGATKGLQFTVQQAASMKYQVQDRDSGSLDVCLMTLTDWNAFNAGGSMRGYACHDNINSATDAATLPVGNYVLAMRCENYFDNCVVDYGLWRGP